MRNIPDIDTRQSITGINLHLLGNISGLGTAEEGEVEPLRRLISGADLLVREDVLQEIAFLEAGPDGVDGSVGFGVWSGTGGYYERGFEAIYWGVLWSVEGEGVKG